MANNPTKHKQTNYRPTFFAKEWFQIEKKLFLLRLEPTVFAIPGVFFASRLSAGYPTTFEIIMNQDTTDSVNQVVSMKKSIFRFDNACSLQALSSVSLIENCLLFQKHLIFFCWQQDADTSRIFKLGIYHSRESCYLHYIFGKRNLSPLFEKCLFRAHGIHKWMSSFEHRASRNF